MKRLTPSLISIVLSLVLALFTAALTYSAPSEAWTGDAAADFFVQGPPAGQSDDRSVTGSTDQIVIMGGVISAIIVIPVLAGRKSWR